MKKSEKRMILILIIVAIIVMAVLVNVKSKKGNDDVGDNQDIAGAGENVVQNEEFVQVLEDGKKLNVSDKLSETKTFGNYEVSNIQLTEENGQSLILADVKNTGEVKSEETMIEITLLDKEEKEIVTIGGIIGAIEIGRAHV